VRVHAVEGPYPVDGTWAFSDAGGATRVDFVAEGPLRGLMRVAEQKRWQCLEHGLLDEIVVYLVPVLLGEGVRFYDAPGVGRIRLERTGLAESKQITDLRFRIVASA
jgi:hypothetical protein